MKNTQDLIIIGGGVMGLMTAYYASQFVKNITILEKGTSSSDNKEASSFSFTRSIHKDYLDPLYITLAAEAQLLWKDLEQKGDEKFFIECGSLGIAKTSVTTDISKSYSSKSLEAKKATGLSFESFDKEKLKQKYPQLDADFGVLDKGAGYMYQPGVHALLLKLLKEKRVTIIENVQITNIKSANNIVEVTTNKDTLATKKLSITVGRWVNDIVDLIEGNRLRFPITLDRPQENKYYYPPKDIVETFYPENFPVFALLDVGIYGHPVFDKKKGAIKIGYYNPPDIERVPSSINSVAAFVEQCLPVLKDAANEDVKDADQCSYDQVDDDEFIIGTLPSFPNIVVGAGWRGTGYKFAPLVGKVLSQLAFQGKTVYDVDRFTPERFVTK